MNALQSRGSKSVRQQSLREILLQNRIVAQDEVVDRMLKLGFQVTQSSISRDFKELGVAKIDGRYGVAATSFNYGLGRFVVKTESAGDHLFVIKTSSGGASAVAEAVDHENIPGVVGTVAGDNTIMVATKDAKTHARISEFLGAL